MNEFFDLAQSHAFFGILVTILAYCAATRIWRRSGSASWLHPVLVASVLVSLVLLTTGLNYEVYRSQTNLLSEALSVIIVLLAIPLSRQLIQIFEAGSEESLLATLVPKSATAAVAMEIAGNLNGWSGITTVIVISTGIFGGVSGPAILSTAGVEDDRARGFALGLASHAIGTARAFQISKLPALSPALA